MELDRIVLFSLLLSFMFLLHILEHFILKDNMLNLDDQSEEIQSSDNFQCKVCVVNKYIDWCDQHVSMFSKYLCVLYATNYLNDSKKI